MEVASKIRVPRGAALELGVRPRLVRRRVLPRALDGDVEGLEEHVAPRDVDEHVAHALLLEEPLAAAEQVVAHGPGEIENEGTRTQTSRTSGSTRPIQPQDHKWLAEGTAEEDTRSQRDRREQRRRRRRNRTERHATRRRCRMQRNEWTRAHRSPHTEATEGADPTSSPRDSRRRHPNEASARGSPPGPWATSRRRPSTASSRARRPAAQSTRAAGCSSPSAHRTRRGELHYRPLRETSPAHLRRPPHKLGLLD